MYVNLSIAFMSCTETILLCFIVKTFPEVSPAVVFVFVCARKTEKNKNTNKNTNISRRNFYRKGLLLCPNTLLLDPCGAMWPEYETQILSRFINISNNLLCF